jgi:hypothetical protein
MAARQGERRTRTRPRSCRAIAERRQPAADLLRLAGVDPALYDLGELRGQRPEPIRYADTADVEIHPRARFVTIRQNADVA